MSDKRGGNISLPVEFCFERKQTKEKIDEGSQPFCASGPARPELRTHIVKHSSPHFFGETGHSAIKPVKIDRDHGVGWIVPELRFDDFFQNLVETENFSWRNGETKGVFLNKIAEEPVTHPLQMRPSTPGDRKIGLKLFHGLHQSRSDQITGRIAGHDQNFFHRRSEE